MSTIVTLADKGSPLTHEEMDQNWNNLNADKIEKSLYGNNTILYKNNAGDIDTLVVDPETFVGRKATGEIVAIPKGELIDLLGLAKKSEKLVLANFEPDGLTYNNTAWAGLNTFKICIANYGSWLVPGVDFSYIALGGFSLIPEGKIDVMAEDLVLYVFF